MSGRGPKLGFVLAALAAATGCSVPEQRPYPRGHPARVTAEELAIAPISSTLDVRLADPIPPREIDR